MYVCLCVCVCLYLFISRAEKKNIIMVLNFLPCALKCMKPRVSVVLASTLSESNCH